MEEPVIGGKQTYRPLFSKRVVVVSQPLSKINFNISHKQDQDIKSLLFLNAGNSKVDITMDKDAYQAEEMINLHLLFNNTACDEAIKHSKVRLIREFTSISSNGTEYKDR